MVEKGREERDGHGISMLVNNCPFRLLIVFYHTDTELEKMGIGWDRRGG